MKRNVGKTDKIIRIIFGIVLIALGIIFESWLGLFGIIPIVTAITGSCGIYLPFGIDTRKNKTDE